MQNAQRNTPLLPTDATPRPATRVMLPGLTYVAALKMAAPHPAARFRLHLQLTQVLRCQTGPFAEPC